MDWKNLRINAEQFKTNFEQLARIGDTGDGGVNRPALGEAHLEARAWFREKIEQAGLEFRTDGAGNHSAYLGCGPADAPTLLLGSHLDSVVNGGRFDGSLGVLAALEVLQIVQEAGLSLPVNLEAIDFTDEEGSLLGLFGSSALAGKLSAEDLENPRGGRENLEAGLKRAGLTKEGLLNATRDPKTLVGYLELHIEQGARLLNQGIHIGIVTSIVGIASYQVSFIGRADHAGTTSMEDRLDAAQGAAEFTLAAREMVMEAFPGCVVNVGEMIFKPGAYNIVPERVTLSLEFRSPEEESFDQLEGELMFLAKDSADNFGLGVDIEFQGKHAPSPMSEEAQAAFANACQTLNLTHTPLSSGAGHDAQSLADLCPVGMIFVPSLDGASHSPREFTKWEDCVNGANVLLQAALEMAAGD